MILELSPVVQPQPRAVLVNTIAGAIEMTEENWDWGNYDWFLVEGNDAAYAVIRSIRPDLVVLLMPMNGDTGCRLMSVLRLDHVTASIPIVIYTATTPESESNEQPSTGRLN